jgi:peptide-methionine (R)-S-oxide reductase
LKNEETTMMTRRTMTLGIFGSALAGLGLSRLFGAPSEAKGLNTYEVSYSEEDWKRRLTPEQYRILRGHGTEIPGTSPLNAEKRQGSFACAGCDNTLFRSATKFESGTGWPSFYQPVEGAVGTTRDNSLLMTRTEVHCARCGGHLGHVFDDGPKPTGLRYCMNGAAMTFQPATSS